MTRHRPAKNMCESILHANVEHLWRKKTCSKYKFLIYNIICIIISVSKSIVNIKSNCKQICLINFSKYSTALGYNFQFQLLYS